MRSRTRARVAAALGAHPKAITAAPGGQPYVWSGAPAAEVITAAPGRCGVGAGLEIQPDVSGAG
jgi:hypothetical protein